jgi:hypothetical protein
MKLTLTLLLVTLVGSYLAMITVSILLSYLSTKRRERLLDAEIQELTSPSLTSSPNSQEDHPLE